MTGKGLSTIGPLDLASLNDDNFVITIVFPHSTAKNYPMAVAIAELSDVNKIGEIAGKKFHLASFSKSLINFQELQTYVIWCMELLAFKPLLTVSWL